MNFSYPLLFNALALEFLNELFIAKNRVLGYPWMKIFVILACVVLTQCQRVTDRRADGQPDLSPIKTE